mmetsp:Transcript_43050/g.104203  ORF Transcript_43050/g.104203 Transcript_43050/m.104203 type:complete len:219 (+) Transcript_43050:44-700(+)
MRNILDKVHRELSVSKKLMAERRELRRRDQEGDYQEEESPPSAMIHDPSYLRGHDSDHHRHHQDNIAPSLNENQERLRGSKKEQQQRVRRMLAEEDHGPPEEEGPGLAFNRDSAMYEPFSDMDQAFPSVLDNATKTADNVTAIGNHNGIVNGNDHPLDVGAWLLMVLVVGFAVFGIVIYRNGGNNNSPRCLLRRRGSNDYQYKGVLLPTLNEDDWGAE